MNSRIVRLLGIDPTPAPKKRPLKRPKQVAIARAAFQCGCTPNVIAKSLDVNVNTVKHWVYRDRFHGIDADERFISKWKTLWRTK